MAITNVREVFEKVSKAFDPDAAKGLDAVFQFDITGEGGGLWNVAVKEGACEVKEGKADVPPWP
jgi:hypothetical protein